MLWYIENRDRELAVATMCATHGGCQELDAIHGRIRMTDGQRIVALAQQSCDVLLELRPLDVVGTPLQAIETGADPTASDACQAHDIASVPRCRHRLARISRNGRLRDASQPGFSLSAICEGAVDQAHRRHARTQAAHVGIRPARNRSYIHEIIAHQCNDHDRCTGLGMQFMHLADCGSGAFEAFGRCCPQFDKSRTQREFQVCGISADQTSIRQGRENCMACSLVDAKALGDRCD